MTADEKRATLNLMGWVPRGAVRVQRRDGVWAVASAFYGGVVFRSKLPNNWPTDDQMSDVDVHFVYAQVMNYVDNFPYDDA